MSARAATSNPSSPFPETAERRAAITREIMAATGLDEPTLERLVRRFYDAARRDAVIGPLFAHVHDWEAHIANISTFWSSVALMTGRYHGQPMAAHLKLRLEPPHFVRWLALFEETVRATCPEQSVAYLMDKAQRIAHSLEIGCQVAQGQLPPRRAR